MEILLMGSAKFHLVLLSTSFVVENSYTLDMNFKFRPETLSVSRSLVGN